MKKIIIAAAMLATTATTAYAAETAYHTGDSYQNGNRQVCEYRTIGGYTFWLAMQPYRICKFTVRNNGYGWQ